MNLPQATERIRIGHRHRFVSPRVFPNGNGVARSVRDGQDGLPSEYQASIGATEFVTDAGDGVDVYVVDRAEVRTAISLRIL